MTLDPPAGSAPAKPTAVEAVSSAFALGWQMAQLFSARLAPSALPTPDEDLPGLSRLPAASLVALGLAQVDAGSYSDGSFSRGRHDAPDHGEHPG